MSFPLKHPEAAAIFGDLLVGLVGESDRGAVLVGQAIVENALEEAIRSVVPEHFTAHAKRDLFKYPGPLSSFAAKVSVAAAFRLIPAHFADAMHALRKMRNDVAHSPQSFSLVGLEHRYRSIFELGPDMPDGIRRTALEMMVEYKTSRMLEIVETHRAEDPELPLPATKSEMVDFIQGQPEILKALEDQLPRWELALGLTLICSILIKYRDEFRAALKPDETLGRILKERAQRGGPRGEGG